MAFENYTDEEKEYLKSIGINTDGPAIAGTATMGSATAAAAPTTAEAPATPTLREQVLPAISSGLTAVTPERADVEDRASKKLQVLKLTSDPAMVKSVEDSVAAIKDVESTAGMAAMAGVFAGFTMDFDDEILGAIVAGGTKFKEALKGIPEDKRQSFTDYYQLFRDELRGKKEQLLSEHKVPYLAGAVAGGVVNAGVTGGLGPEISAGAKVALETAAWSVGSGTADLTEGELKQAGKEFLYDSTINLAFVGTVHGVIAAGKKAVGTASKANIERSAKDFVANDALQQRAVEALDADKEAVTQIRETMANPEAVDDIVNFEPKGDATTKEFLRSHFGDAGYEHYKESAVRSLGHVDEVTAEALATDEGAVVHTYVKNDIKEFGRVINGGKAIPTEDIGATFGKIVERETPEFIEKRYQIKRLADEMIALSDTEVLPKPRNGKIGLAYLYDGRAVYEALSNRHGMELTPTIDKLSNGIRLTNMNRSMWLKPLQALVESVNESKLDTAVLRQVVEKPEKYPEVVKSLTPDQRKVVAMYRQLTEGMRAWASGNGLKIAENKNYVPHMAMAAEELIPQINARVRAVEAKFGPIKTWTPEQFAERMQQADVAHRAPAPDDPNLLAWGVRYITGADVKSPKDFLNALNQARDVNYLSTNMASRAGVAMERDLANPMPTWIRETDVAKLVPRWIEQVSKHIYMREGIAELQAAIPVLEARGDVWGAGYVKRHINDLMGVRPDTIKSWLSTKTIQGQAALADRANIAREGGNKFAATMMDAVASAPDMLSKLTQQIYPYYLGTSPVAVFRNLTQTWALGATHLSSATESPITSTFGSKLAAKSWIETVADWKGAFRDARLNGVLGDVHNPEYFEIMKKGVAEGSGLGAKAGVMLDKANNLAMAAFTASENFNRVVTAKMAEKWGTALIAGDKEALQALRGGLDIGYQNKILRSLRAGNNGMVQRDLRHALLAKTAFNYDRATMSEFGRAWGTYFSMFTKWPSSVIGDVSGLVGQGKYKQTLAKYGTPLALAMFLDGYVSPASEREGLEKKLLGKGSFTSSWSPAGAAAGIGGMGKPAVLSTVTNALQQMNKEAFNNDMIYSVTHPSEVNYEALVPDVKKLAAGQSKLSPLIPGSTWLAALSNVWYDGE